MSEGAQGIGVSAPGPGHISLDSGLAPSQARCQLQFGQKAQQTSGWMDSRTDQEQERFCRMSPHSQDEGRGPGPAVEHQDVQNLHRQRQCCRLGVPTALLVLVMAALWAGLLTLLLLWRWDTVQDLKQLEDTAALNISQVSKDLERHKGDQMARRSQEAQALQIVEEIQAEQKRMKDQDSELSRDLDGLREVLTNLKSQGLNERRAALTSLEKLQEEVSKLWVELRVSSGSMCNTCPEEWVSFQRKCYYFGEGAKKWIQARFACSNLQGRLVSIHSQEEQDFLAKYVNKKGSWIGLRDLNIEGEFVWMDGGPLDYSNWRPGEPNNGGEGEDWGEGEDCVMMLGLGQWNDASCSSHLEAWMCEQLATC